MAKKRKTFFKELIDFLTPEKEDTNVVFFTPSQIQLFLRESHSANALMQNFSENFPDGSRKYSYRCEFVVDGDEFIGMRLCVAPPAPEQCETGSK